MPCPASTKRRQFVPLKIAVLTVSDTRELADDKSGATLAERIEKAGHAVAARAIVTDDVEKIRAQVRAWIADPAIDVDHHHRRHRLHRPRRDAGGGRAAVREAHGRLLHRCSYMVSHAKIGTSTIQTRATAGVAGATYIFCLPGSPGACRDAWDEILVHQLDYRYRPCNFVEIMPRLDEHLRRAKAQDGWSARCCARDTHRRGPELEDRRWVSRASALHPSYILPCTKAPMRSMAARASGIIRAQTCQACGIRGHISSSTSHPAARIRSAMRTELSSSTSSLPTWISVGGNPAGSP